MFKRRPLHFWVGTAPVRSPGEEQTNPPSSNMVPRCAMRCHDDRFSSFFMIPYQHLPTIETSTTVWRVLSQRGSWCSWPLGIRTENSLCGFTLHISKPVGDPMCHSKLHSVKHWACLTIFSHRFPNLAGWFDRPSLFPMLSPRCTCRRTQDLFQLQPEFQIAPRHWKKLPLDWASCHC